MKRIPGITEIGSWSEIKLKIVRAYAEKYSLVLSKQGFIKHDYIDAFAGAGFHLSRGSKGRIIPGSPLNALYVDPPFSEKYVSRIDQLRKTQAKVKFLSLEPLLGPLDNLNLSEIDWVIVGGESGFGARPMSIDWVKGIRQQCVDVNVPFFFKQWGGVHKKRTGRTLEGRTWDQMPVRIAA